MLKYETINNKTKDLLINLSQDKSLAGFFLVGGTALSLQLGHRKSLDLDFLSLDNFNVKDMLGFLVSKYNFKAERMNDNLIIGYINGIKTDFVYEKSTLINPIIIDDNVRLLSVEDICAMKMMAISDNGSRMKDYVDLVEISKQYSLNEMNKMFIKKYNFSSDTYFVKRLTVLLNNGIEYQNINLVNEKFNWEKYEIVLKTMVENMDFKNNNGKKHNGNLTAKRYIYE